MDRIKSGAKKGSTAETITRGRALAKTGAPQPIRGASSKSAHNNMFPNQEEPVRLSGVDRLLLDLTEALDTTDTMISRTRDAFNPVLIDVEVSANACTGMAGHSGNASPVQRKLAELLNRVSANNERLADIISSSDC